MFKKAWRRTSEFYAGGVGLLVQIILSAIVGAVISPSNPANLHWGESNFWAYSAIVLIVLFLFALMVNLIVVYGDKVRYKDLSKLAKFKSLGIDAWNVGLGLHTQEEVTEWTKLYYDWFEKTKKQFVEVSPVRAEAWSRAGTFTKGDNPVWNKAAIDDGHLHFIYFFRHMWQTLGQQIVEINQGLERNE